MALLCWNLFYFCLFIIYLLSGIGISFMNLSLHEECSTFFSVIWVCRFGENKSSSVINIGSLQSIISLNRLSQWDLLFVICSCL